MKAIVVTVLVVLNAAAASALTCGPNEKMATFRILRGISRSGFTALIFDRGEYEIPVTSPALPVIEKVMETHKYWDVNACVDDDSNVTKVVDYR